MFRRISFYISLAVVSTVLGHSSAQSYEVRLNESKGLEYISRNKLVPDILGINAGDTVETIRQKIKSNFKEKRFSENSLNYGIVDQRGNKYVFSDPHSISPSEMLVYLTPRVVGNRAFYLKRFWQARSEPSVFLEPLLADFKAKYGRPLTEWQGPAQGVHMVSLNWIFDENGMISDTDPRIEREQGRIKNNQSWCNDKKITQIKYIPKLDPAPKCTYKVELVIWSLNNMVSNFELTLTDLGLIALAEETYRDEMLKALESVQRNPAPNSNPRL